MDVNFGKCRVEYLRWSGNAFPTTGTWGQILEPVEGSVVLTTNEGTDLEAKIEGGQVIDKLAGKNTYQLTPERGQHQGRVCQDGTRRCHRQGSEGT